MSYIVKPAAPHHIPALSEIERAAATLFTTEDLPELLRNEVIAAQRFEDAQRDDRLWVAVDSADQPVGFLLADVVDDTLHIAEMAVHPEHARRGLGATLLQHMLLVAEHHGHHAVTLTTFSHVAWNAPFYQRQGFVVLGDDECGPELRALLKQEGARGLSHRVAMRRQVRRAERTTHWAERGNS